MQNKTRVIIARVAAYVVDAMFLFIVFFFIGYFLPLPESVNSLIDDLLTFSYFIYFNSKNGNGQTYGKRFFHIKVVENVTQSTISLRNSFIRELLWLIVVFLDWVIRIYFPDISVLKYIDYTYIMSAIVFLTIIFDKNSRGIHDKLARTKVISG